MLSSSMFSEGEKQICEAKAPKVPSAGKKKKLAHAARRRPSFTKAVAKHT